MKTTFSRRGARGRRDRKRVGDRDDVAASAGCKAQRGGGLHKRVLSCWRWPD